MKTPLIAAAVMLLAACANDTAPTTDAASAEPAAPAAEPAPVPEPPRAPAAIDDGGTAPAPAVSSPEEPAATPAPMGWRAVVLPAHELMVDEALTLATAAARGGDEASLDARALLERAREPLQLGEIDGDWRVRSIQVDRQQGYAYPWFDAHIAHDGTGNGSHRFAKTSGSQRRSGRLYPMDGPGLVFLGARTVNDESPRTYTRIATPAAEAPGEHDSAGLLLRIGPNELLMVLDADGERFELYHLRR